MVRRENSHIEMALIITCRKYTTRKSALASPISFRSSSPSPSIVAVGQEYLKRGSGRKPLPVTLVYLLLLVHTHLSPIEVLATFHLRQLELPRPTLDSAVPIHHASRGGDPPPVREAAEAKIGSAAEAPEGVADVVARRDALGKSAVPALDDGADDGDAGVEEVLDGDGEPVLVRDGEMPPVGDAVGRAVEIGTCAQRLSTLPSLFYPFLFLLPLP